MAILSAAQHVGAALERYVTALRLGEGGTVLGALAAFEGIFEFSGRADDVPIRGTIFPGDTVVRLVVEATAARDATRLMLEWRHDERRAGGLRTGDEAFDRVSFVEAAPSDLAHAFLDERTRAGLLELGKWGVWRFEVHEGRIELTMDVAQKRENGQLAKLSPEELETAVGWALAMLRDSCLRLAGIADSADRALLVQRAAPYRGPADFTALAERGEERERERRALATRRVRVQSMTFAGGFLVVLTLCAMLARSC